LGFWGKPPSTISPELNAEFLQNTLEDSEFKPMNKQKGVSSVIGCEEEQNDDNFGFPRAYPYFFDYGDMSKKLCNLFILN